MALARLRSQEWCQPMSAAPSQAEPRRGSTNREILGYKTIIPLVPTKSGLWRWLPQNSACIAETAATPVQSPPCEEKSQLANNYGSCCNICEGFSFKCPHLSLTFERVTQIMAWGKGDNRRYFFIVGSLWSACIHKNQFRKGSIRNGKQERRRQNRRKT